MSTLSDERVFEELLRWFRAKTPAKSGEKTSHPRSVYRCLMNEGLFPKTQDKGDIDDGGERVKGILKSLGKKYFTFVPDKGYFIFHDKVGRIVAEMYGSAFWSAQRLNAHKIARAHT
jgi:hypothetical protein